MLLVIGIVFVMLVNIVAVDLAIRYITDAVKKRQIRREREEALDIGLKMEIDTEAKSLKSVQVNNPKAKILAVDDEKIILDSFRKILVLDGYSIDTVETGPEALGLVQKNDYDFVFTDLKMPIMDGVEVTKSVKHLRPDVDVVMITGYASVESAVDVMKYGAMDYIQKPFTAEELTDAVRNLVFRREDRLQKEFKPVVRLVTAATKESDSKREFNIPGGVFISPGHTWLTIEHNGQIRVGIDDFSQKIIDSIDSIEPPQHGQKVRKGETLFTIIQGARRFSFVSPVSGTVDAVNSKLIDQIELIKKLPYRIGWVCSMTARNLIPELQDLKIGEDAVEWYQSEIDKYTGMIKNRDTNEEFWETFSSTFLR